MFFLLVVVVMDIISKGDSNQHDRRSIAKDKKKGTINKGTVAYYQDHNVNIQREIVVSYPSGISIPAYIYICIYIYT